MNCRTLLRSFSSDSPKTFQCDGPRGHIFQRLGLVIVSLLDFTLSKLCLNTVRSIILELCCVLYLWLMYSQDASASCWLGFCWDSDHHCNGWLRWVWELDRLDGCNFHVTTCSTNKIVVMFSLALFTYNPYFLACFLSYNIVFLSQPISRNNVSAFFQRSERCLNLDQSHPLVSVNGNE